MKGTISPAAYARLWAICLFLSLAVLALCLLVGVGSDGKSPILAWPSADIRQIRILRLLAAALIGFALSGAGVALQALLRNPLADPYILGISSGSSVGVMIWLLITGPLWATAAARSSPALQSLLTQGQALPALAGAIVTCILVYVLSWPRRRDSAGSSGADPLTLLLVGVVLAAINGALLFLLNSLVPQGVRADFFNYMTGAISNDTTWLGLAIAAVICLAGYLPLLAASAALNIGSLSDLEAASLGIHIARLRTLCFVSGAVMTAAAILLAGPIGFVGLICPHICRSLLGPDHRKLLVAAPFAGAIFLLLTDTFVRASVGLFHGELAVGVVTALLGGPFFLLLLKRRSLWGSTAGGGGM
ncbi:MAG TPA: iron ABC transporter permease [Phycisphaerae bacterium]|nr:iron ABC transporter permease [Phycisphaerae bacterium]